MYATSTFVLSTPATSETADDHRHGRAGGDDERDAHADRADEHHPADRLEREVRRDDRARERPDRERGQHEPDDPAPSSRST